tara:strand:+ start:21712 stop:22767 length:1056 start_codon:yes stop_codon:yes gene_type:complete
MRKLYQSILFYLVVFCVTYFIYVYPFEILNELIFSEKPNRKTSFYYTIIISILIIFYFRSYASLKPLKIFIYEGMGIGFISFWILTLAIIVLKLFNINAFYLGIFSLILILFFSLISFYFGSKIYLKELYIKSDKILSDSSFVFISDVHLGSNSINHLKKIIHKLKNINFDFILIGGDLIDSSAFDLNNFKIITEKIKCPIYFVTGNHEYYIKNSNNKIKEINNFGIKHLSNKNTNIMNLNIIGIDDNLSRDQQVQIIKKKYSNDKFNLCLIHKPSIWDKVYNESDLMISGHTHGGQIFPFNFFVMLQFKFKYGLYSYDNSKLYVSSGAGTWGPKMRLGTFNEIILFHLSK